MCEPCTLIAHLASRVHSVHSSLKACSEHTNYTLCAHLLQTEHTCASCAHLCDTDIQLCKSSYIWQGNAEQCTSFAPGLLKIEEDVDHRAVTLPDLAAVTLYFDPEKQHHATIPAGIQVDLKVVLSACTKRGGGGRKRHNPSAGHRGTL